MDFLHQFTLPCVLWFFSFIKPSLGHLPLARTFFFALLQGIFIYPVKRENFPFTVQYNDTNVRSKSLWLSHFLFPPTSLFWPPQSLPSLHAELRLPLDWISLLPPEEIFSS